MPAEEVDRLEILAGMPLRGLVHPAAPLRSNAEDAIAQAANPLLRDCRLLDAGYVQARARQLYRLAENSAATRSLVGYFTSPDALAANRTWATRSTIHFGAPVQCSPGKEADDNGATVACKQGELVEPRSSSARAVGFTPHAYAAFLVELKQSMFDAFGRTAG